MIAIFCVSSKYINESCLPDPVWRDKIQYMKCKQCRALLREYVEVDPQAEIEFEGKQSRLSGPIVPIGIGRYGVPWQLVREDFAEAFRLREEGFQLWPVTLKKQSFPGYYCVSQPYEPRLFNYSKSVLSFGFCKACGRMGGRMDVTTKPQIWAPSLRDDKSLVDEHVYNSRRVYTSSTATRFFMTAEALAGIPTSLRKDLEIVECDVVENV